MLSAEGAASLPVPTFMSFGTYEAGGTVALTLLGFSVEGSKIAMFALHIWSQFADYLLGGAGFILFVMLAGRRRIDIDTFNGKRRRIYFLAICSIIAVLSGMAFLGLEYRKTKKMGAISPPPSGEAVTIMESEGDIEKIEKDLVKGFIVWSSNRYGTHDILRMSMPDGIIERLTTSSHVDTYPRISPDGSEIIFCRSREEWVSQRNPVPWDAWLFDFKTGKERKIAEFAFMPTWVSDGKAVVFVRNGRQVVRLNIVTGEEDILCRSGKGGFSDRSIFQTPSYNQKLDAVAVTLRGSSRGTVVIYLKTKKQVRVGGGCQLGWVAGNAASLLCYVDHEGHDNIIYGYDLDAGVGNKLVNLDGVLSHEYFPKFSNDGRYMVFCASAGGRSQHEHDTSDYEVFLWKYGASPTEAIRLTHHTGNDCWPDIFVKQE